MSAKLGARLRALEAAAGRSSAERARRAADGAHARLRVQLGRIAAAVGPAPAPADPAKLAEIRRRLLALSDHGREAEP